MVVRGFRHVSPGNIDGRNRNISEQYATCYSTKRTAKKAKTSFSMPRGHTVHFASMTTVAYKVNTAL